MSHDWRKRIFNCRNCENFDSKKTLKNNVQKITVQKYLKNISQEKFELMDTQTINYRKVALNTDKTVSALTC